MNVNTYNKTDYENIANWTLGENKPNSNPISEKPKMNVNLYVIKEYENETAFRLEQNKPKQSQFLYHWLRLLFIIPGLCKKSRYINSALLARES